LALPATSGRGPGRRCGGGQPGRLLGAAGVGATIYFGPDVEWGATWRAAESWKSGFVKDTWAGRVPDGTHPADPFNGGTSV
jgi:hypothetical protein